MTFVSTAFGNNELHVALWIESLDNAVWEVLYLKSSAGCGNWTPAFSIAERRLEGDMAYVYNPRPIAVTAIDQAVYLIWSEPPLSVEPLHETQIFFRRSGDRGETWDLAQRLETAESGEVLLEAIGIAATETMLHVVSSSGYFQSNDMGDTWSDLMPERSGLSIATSPGWVSIIKRDDAYNLFHLRFPESE